MRRFTKEDRLAILKRIRKDGNIQATARSINRSRAVLVSYLNRHPNFKRRVLAARAEAWERLEAEAVRRGVEGVKKPVFQGGRLVGHERVYSDGLLTMLIRARMPKVYDRPSKHEVEARHNWADLIKIARAEAVTDTEDMDALNEIEEDDD